MFYYLLSVLVLLPLVKAGIELVFIGTGAGGSSRLRGSTSMALRLNDGEVWMFDCGEGTSLKMHEVFIRPSKVGAIFITHLHGDHTWGLPSILCSHWNNNDTNASKRGKGFHVFGPRGIRKLLRAQLLLSRSLCMFQYTVHELIPQECQYDSAYEARYYKVVETAEFPLHPQEILGRDIEAVTGDDGHPVWHLVNDTRGTMVAGMITHRLPTFGYTFIESSPIPNLRTHLLQSKYNLTPGVEYGMLQRGIPVRLPNNVTIQPSEVLETKARGRKITILGDTSNPWAMYGIAQESDVLVHEATHFKHQSEAADFFGHSTPTQAVRFAKGIGAKVLALTHISQRVTARSSTYARFGAKTCYTTDDIMNEAVDELFKYRYKNLSIFIAEDGTTLRMEKKDKRGLGNRWFTLTRQRKSSSPIRTFHETVPVFYHRPPSDYNLKFKPITFKPPLKMLTNFSRAKFAKYYGPEVIDSERMLEDVPQGPRYETVLEYARRTIRRPFFKSIQGNRGRSMDSSLLTTYDNRTYINLDRSGKVNNKAYYFNKTVSEHYYQKYGNQTGDDLLRQYESEHTSR